MWLRDNPRFESHFGDEPNHDAGDDDTKKKARPRGRDKAKHAQAQKKAIDIIKNKVTCAVKDIVRVRLPQMICGRYLQRVFKPSLILRNKWLRIK